MYNLISKLLSIFLDPAAFLFILLLCAFLVRRWRPRLSQTLLCTALILLLVAACPMASQMLLLSLERQYPDRGLGEQPSAQAIVVLGGSLKIPGGLHHNSGLTNSSDRLLEALRLYRAGKAPLVEVSGGDNPLVLEARQEHEADEMRSLLEEWGMPESAILVEDQSINTRENALFSRKILAARGIQHIILVTSAIHMPRAAATFRKVGFDVEAAPADFLTGWQAQAKVFQWFPASGALLDSNNALHEWIGFWVYRLRGWA